MISEGGYAKLIALADEIKVSFLNPKSFQETNFVQNEPRVYKTSFFKI